MDEDVLIVIPTLNEAENLVELLEGIRAHVPGASVLIVDDGSPDGTAALARGRRYGRGACRARVRAQPCRRESRRRRAARGRRGRGRGGPRAARRASRQRRASGG